MGDEPNARVKAPKYMLSRSHKGRRFIQIAGRWPRKSASAKKCVTTYLPNESAPKMDGAQAYHEQRPILNRQEADDAREGQGRPWNCKIPRQNEALTSRREREGRREPAGR